MPDVMPEPNRLTTGPIYAIDGDEDLPPEENPEPSLDEIFKDFDWSNGQVPFIYGNSIHPELPDNGIRAPEFYGTEFMFPKGEWPIVFEDLGTDGMGESIAHSTAATILFAALELHFRARQPNARVIQNMNVYYTDTNRRSHVSPDVMVVDPPLPLPPNLRSYRLDRTGPAPFLAVEVLSERTYRQGDLGLKLVLYASFGVEEYLLVDTTGEFLPERLLLKKRVGDERWDDEYDTGDGVVSSYGFRVTIDDDERVRVSDAVSGRAYPRPDEADEIAMERDELVLERDELVLERDELATERDELAMERDEIATERDEIATERDEAARARSVAEARVRELEAELARLRGENPTTN